jgi:hypothetical protein
MSDKSSLNEWSILYPAKTLIDLNPMARPEESIEQFTARKMQEIVERFGGSFSSQSNAAHQAPWYVLAPLLLDWQNGHDEYVNDWFRMMFNHLKSDSRKQEFFLKLKDKFDEYKNEKIPQSLAEYLAKLAIGGIGVCVARTLQNDGGENDGIIRLSQSFVSMFNRYDAVMILQRLEKNRERPRWWYQILEYCIDGNFQAMLDEYYFLLKTNGHDGKSALEVMIDASAFSTTRVGCEFQEDVIFEKKDENESSDPEKSRLRCHYAVPMGIQKMTDEKGQERMGNIRDVFNSPFRPFVLNSTSIGQEGLDFHWYCRRVIHWNLPSNPIDIEQREGRVNRFMSLVVRKRIVEKFANKLPWEKEYKNPWDTFFRLADEWTKESRTSDLVPYWHYPDDGEKKDCIKIDRIVPMMPMSRDIKRYKESLKILSLYRLAFGQPRQEELLNSLLEKEMSEEEIKMLNENLVINLSPLRKK